MQNFYNKINILYSFYSSTKIHIYLKSLAFEVLYSRYLQELHKSIYFHNINTNTFIYVHLRIKKVSEPNLFPKWYLISLFLLTPLLTYVHKGNMNIYFCINVLKLCMWFWNFLHPQAGIIQELCAYILDYINLQSSCGG